MPNQWTVGAAKGQELKDIEWWDIILQPETWFQMNPLLLCVRKKMFILLCLNPSRTVQLFQSALPFFHALFPRAKEELRP